MWISEAIAVFPRSCDGHPIAFGFLTSAAFTSAYVVFGLHGYRSSLEFVGICWLMAPVPLLVTNALFVKPHPLIVLAHSLGWLAKFGLAAVAAAWLLR
jgi:hypothetical protein